jgi:hypothetical protein
MTISRRQLLAAAGGAVVAAAIDTGGLRGPAAFASPPPVANPGGGAINALGWAPTTPDGPADQTTLRKTVLIGTPDPTTGYATLTQGDPELHTVRSELGGAAFNPTYYVTAFVQMTDLHIVDDQSPLRVEFLDQYANPGPPHYASYETAKAYRPHESLSTQVVDAMCRAIRQVGRGPRTNLPLAFTIVTGDSVDNTQYNETRWYIDVLDGGKLVTPNSGSPTLDHSVTSDALGLDVNYWHAAHKDFEISNKKGPGLDTYFKAGFPSVPQMPHAARQPFNAVGLGMPWFAAFGNHDALVLGNIPGDSALLDFLSIDVSDFVRGTFKPSKLLGLPDQMPSGIGDIGGYFDLATAGLFHVMSGVEVPSDPNRRLLSKQEFINEHFVNTTPGGHGLPFDGNSRAYYVMNPIHAAGLTVGAIGYINDCVDPGIVQSQNPNGGVAVPLGSAVGITISTCNSGGGGGGGGGDGGPTQPK